MNLNTGEVIAEAVFVLKGRGFSPAVRGHYLQWLQPLRERCKIKPALWNRKGFFSGPWAVSMMRLP